MKIAIDLDGVLCNTSKVSLKYVNKKRCTNYTEKDITSYNWEDWFDGWTKEDSRKLFLRKNIFKNTPIIQDSLESVLLLAKNNFEIEYLSARDKSIEDITYQWIYKNGFPHRKIVLFDHSSDKINYLWDANPKFDVLVEDKLATVLEMQSYIFFNYLIDYPYNQHTKSYWITRVKGWKEIIEDMKLWGFIK